MEKYILVRKEKNIRIVTQIVEKLGLAERA